MKQKLRRFMAGFLAILTMFTTLFTNGTTAFAASSSANISFWYASAKDHGVISEFIFTNLIIKRNYHISTLEKSHTGLAVGYEAELCI